jgi:hypothetical protein
MKVKASPHLCPLCHKLMEARGQVYICWGCNISRWGPFLEEGEKK